MYGWKSSLSVCLLLLALFFLHVVLFQSFLIHNTIPFYPVCQSLSIENAKLSIEKVSLKTRIASIEEEKENKTFVADFLHFLKDKNIMIETGDNNVTIQKAPAKITSTQDENQTIMADFFDFMRNHEDIMIEIRASNITITEDPAKISRTLDDMVASYLDYLKKTEKKVIIKISGNKATITKDLDYLATITKAPAKITSPQNASDREA